MFNQERSLCSFNAVKSPTQPPPLALINQILPEEMLEKIFSFTSQYKDYANISRVCLKWFRIIVGLRKLNRLTFNDSFENGQIYWRCFDNKFSPQQRHSHSSARLDDKLFVFGGLSGTSTSYNDLWSFDLNTKTWSRPTTSGSYPSPKAAATLLPYKNKYLILYGGYSHPYSYPFNQQVNFFDELHIYHTDTGKDLNASTVYTCSQILFSQEAPKLAGHTASIINNNKMILFGGCNGSLGNKTNKVYYLDLEDYKWTVGIYSSSNSSSTFINTSSSSSSSSLSSALLTRQIDGFRPEPRYGHSQITLDDERVLIIGGCGGPNKQYDDVWILNWPKDLNKNASWQQVIIQNHINAPSQLYCISFVRSNNNKLITFGKPRMPQLATISNNSDNNETLSNINSKYLNLNEASSSNPLTIYGSIEKAIQLRKCSCSTSFSASLDTKISSVSNLNKTLTKSSSSGKLVANGSIPSKDSSSESLKNESLSSTDETNNIQQQPSTSSSGTSTATLLNKSQRNTIKRLEALKKIATKFNKLKDEKEMKIMQQLNSTTSLTKTQNHCVVHSKVMQTFVLDLNKLFAADHDSSDAAAAAAAAVATTTNSNIPVVSWQTPIAEFDQAPPDTILYSLTSGIDEIILFGGMELDSPLINLKPSYEYIKHRVSNKLYIFKPDSLFIPALTH